MNCTRKVQNQNQNSCVGDSRVTRDSNQLKIKKKVSLLSCQSVTSVEDNQTMYLSKLQQKLFLKFLSFKNHPRHKMEVFQKMRYFYFNMPDQKTITFDFLKSEYLSQLPKQFKPEDKNILCYYFGSWLYFMHYLTQKNKKIVLQVVKFSIPEKYLPQAIRFYETLGHQYLKGLQRFNLLLSICQNGWIFFSTFISMKIRQKYQL